MKKIRENIKLIIGIFIGITVSSISVYAAAVVASKNVTYDNTASKMKAGNVQDAIDELYCEATNYNALKEEMLDTMYPVGSIYITTSLTSTSQVAQKLGGTWESYGQGRTLVGMGSNGTTDYTTVNSTGGSESQNYTPAGTNSGGTVTGGNISYTPAGTNSGGAVGNHTLTVAEIPSHSHYANNFVINSTAGSAITVGSGNGRVGYNNRNVFSTNSTGGGGAHNHPFTQPTFTGKAATLTHTHTVTQPTFTGTAATISHMQPYITVYIYRRTA